MARIGCEQPLVIRALHKADPNDETVESPTLPTRTLPLRGSATIPNGKNPTRTTGEFRLHPLRCRTLQPCVCTMVSVELSDLDTYRVEVAESRARNRGPAMEMLGRRAPHPAVVDALQFRVSIREIVSWPLLDT